MFMISARQLIKKLKKIEDKYDFKGEDRAVIFLARGSIEQWIRDKKNMSNAHRALDAGYEDLDQTRRNDD